MRALSQGKPIRVRNPQATRPWQHILEPLAGYLTLAEKLYCQLNSSNQVNHQLEGAFNFGPRLDSNQSVRVLIEEILKHWSGSWLDQSDPHAVHEANLLNLVTDKAFHLLNWQPQWDFAATIKQTVIWYHQANQMSAKESGKFQSLTLEQINQYHKLLTRS